MNALLLDEITQNVSIIPALLRQIGIAANFSEKIVITFAVLHKVIQRRVHEDQHDFVLFAKKVYVNRSVFTRVK